MQLSFSFAHCPFDPLTLRWFFFLPWQLTPLPIILITPKSPVNSFFRTRVAYFKKRGLAMLRYAQIPAMAAKMAYQRRIP
jgi:hypothetical protein